MLKKHVLVFIFGSIFIIASVALVAAARGPLEDTYTYLPIIEKDQDNSTATPTATTEPTTPAEATPTPEATTTPTSGSLAETWMAAWKLNTSEETSPIFSGVVVDISTVYTKTVGGQDYQCITASGIPSYETTITQDIIDGLNNRQKAATDFASNGQTTVELDQVVKFGEDVGYVSSGCETTEEGYGYWPPGPACPTEQSKDQCFPLNPEPSVDEADMCETGLADMGTFVNGVGIWNWQDGSSYNNQGVWQNEAFHFERNDLDIIPGHSANGRYHHHSNPWALGDQLGDIGDSHSPIYGFAADGYPVYGPWHADSELAVSCWSTRDYDDPSSATGCGVAGERSCQFVDELDISQGVVSVDLGPSTSDSVSSLSGNVFTTTSGYYREDYYYEASCSAQGIQYLDEHNGHDHDGLGYHYHVTVVDNGNGTYEDVFPFYIGPVYAGILTDEAIASCDGGGGPGGPPGGGGGPGGPP
ncbi:MAG: YHYH protein [Anaerolineae bacterium]